MQKTRKASLLILLLAFVFAIGVFFVASPARASALEETASAAPVTEEAAEDIGEDGWGTYYSVLYFLMDGATAATLIGIHASQGWEMALWFSFIFWGIAIVAGIFAVILAKLFSKNSEKPFNCVALLGFVFSVFLPLAGLILSVFGMKNEGTQEGGKLYYTLGFVFSFVFCFIAFLLALVHLFTPILPF